MLPDFARVVAVSVDVGRQCLRVVLWCPTSPGRSNSSLRGTADGQLLTVNADATRRCGTATVTDQPV